MVITGLASAMGGTGCLGLDGKHSLVMTPPEKKKNMTLL